MKYTAAHVGKLALKQMNFSCLKNLVLVAFVTAGFGDKFTGLFFIDGIGQLVEGVVLVVGLFFAADHFQQVAFTVVKLLFGTDRAAHRVVHRAADQAHQAIYGLGHEGATGVADPPLAGDQYGSEPAGLVYAVLVADVLRVGCVVLVWESGMHSHGNRGNEVMKYRSMALT